MVQARHSRPGAVQPKPDALQRSADQPRKLRMQARQRCGPHQLNQALEARPDCRFWLHKPGASTLPFFLRQLQGTNQILAVCVLC